MCVLLEIKTSNLVYFRKVSRLNLSEVLGFLLEDENLEWVKIVKQYENR